jgi:ribonucleoside-diphosphate reductase alpha chain
MQVYTREEVTKNALEYFHNDELAAHVWVNKYALKNTDGDFVEDSPQARFSAIAEELNRINLKYSEPHRYDDFRKAMVEGYILPGGSGLSGIANPYSIVSLGNCFVTTGNNEDSIGSIWKVDQESAQIYKRRGGNGVDLSFIRPAGTLVTNAAGSTTGPISFAEQYSQTVRRIGQEGRRGALMLSMSVHHPDVLQFAVAKNDDNSITGANISIRISNEFMNAVKNDGCYLQRFPVNAPEISMLELEEDNVYTHADGTIYIKTRARKIFDEIVRVNWESAEPGMLFWDKIISESPADCYAQFQTESTNPCGELPLSPYDSCRLLATNLTKYVVFPYTPEAVFDVRKFKEHVKMATWMMDNIIDLEIEKINIILEKIDKDVESDFTKMVELELWKKILENTKNGRRAGISLIGHGDFLAMLGIKYDSAEGKNLLETVHQIHATETYRTSIELAKSRGAFPAFDFDRELKNPFLQRIYDTDPSLREEMRKYGRRNIALLTIPPAGTLSLVLRQTSGFEPAFLLYYKRRRKINPEENDKVDFVDSSGDSWQEYFVLHPKFQDWIELQINTKVFPDALSDEDLAAWAKASPWSGSLTNDIDPTKKVELQGAIQKWVDHSISVTHNLPEDVKPEVISELYMKAWEEGCKGCTVYREGSRAGVLVSTEKKEANEAEFEYKDAPKRPRELPCDIYFPTIHGKKYVVLVGLYAGKPYEVFALGYKHTIPTSVKEGILKKQKSRHYVLLDKAKNIVVDDIRSAFDLPEWDFATRMISTALRHGASIDYVVEQLNKSGKDALVTDLARVIARQLKKYVKAEVSLSQKCPECGEPMRVEGGCKQCVNPECGYGKCG